MRALPRTPFSLVRDSAIALLVAALLLTWPASGTAEALDSRLQEAQERRVEVQERLDSLYQRLSAVTAEAEALQAELNALRAQREAHVEEATEANSALAFRVRESYVRGTTDPTFTLLASGNAETALEQARLLGLLAVRSRADFETASAARVRTEATAEEVEHKHEQVRDRQAEIEAVRSEVAQALAEAQAEEQQVRDQIAREERERREREERERRAREERAARERASRSNTSSSTSAPAPAPAPAPASGGGGGQQAPAAPSGGVACPVGQPRSYSDTWGAPRSGGRSHKGTDIMAPRGTPIYAYESGTVTRLWNSRLGGISLYLRGNSGNVYYYTHLQGYVSGLSGGQQVSVGQHIAFNGDTGNARGIPHLHFEVMPGGGGNVNPYPYVVRACG